MLLCLNGLYTDERLANDVKFTAIATNVVCFTTLPRYRTPWAAMQMNGCTVIKTRRLTRSNCDVKRIVKSSRHNCSFFSSYSVDANIFLKLIVSNSITIFEKIDEEEVFWLIYLIYRFFSFSSFKVFEQTNLFIPILTLWNVTSHTSGILHGTSKALKYLKSLPLFVPFK